MPRDKTAQEILESVYLEESPKILATLVRLLGDIDLAEDAMQEAVLAASHSWPDDGVPQNPRSWLISTARFKGIDVARREAKWTVKPSEETELADPRSLEDFEEESIEDDLLRLVFLCCHPILSLEHQVALTLREVCGLSTEEIARAFLLNPTALAQRIVRAKTRIREANVPYEIPQASDLAPRRDGVLRVTYLLFNEGYYTSDRPDLSRKSLSSLAIGLGRTLTKLLPDPEVQGLLALMLLHESRRNARVSSDGTIVLLEDQDRALWDQDLIREGAQLTEAALGRQSVGPYALQAAIAWVHATSPTFDSTNWEQILQYYDLLLAIEPSPVVALNRAVAVSMCQGDRAGLDLVEELLASGKLSNYCPAYSAQAYFLRRLGQYSEARRAYERALELSADEPTTNYLRRTLAELGD